MKLNSPKPGSRGDEKLWPAPSLREIIRKSALLNVAVVLTSLPVLVWAGGPRSIVPVLDIMAGISVVIWAATFSVFSFVSLARIYRSTDSSSAGNQIAPRRRQAGIADPWLDDPV
jgi:hypothetical protein